MKDFQKNKETILREMEQFVSRMNELLPRYVFLANNQSLTNDELTELGEIEHLLIEINGRIALLKEKLSRDLFGHSLDLYYQLKKKSEAGDHSGDQQLERLRLKIEKAFSEGKDFIWN